MVYTFVTFCSNSIFALTHALRNTQFKGEIIYRVELPDMEQITLIYLENSDADYRKSSATNKTETSTLTALTPSTEKKDEKEKCV